ncbi:Ionotropic receptor 421 [Blattella germanica]|nr:Ionotropic receptor 421 [Blattella germanica]
MIGKTRNMHLKCVVLLLSFWGSCESRLTLSEDKSLEPYLAQCVIEIMSKYFDKNMPMVVETPGTFLSHENQNYDSGDKFIEMIQNQVQCSLLIIGNREFGQIAKWEQLSPGSYIFLLPPLNTDKDIEFLTLMKKRFILYNYNFYYRAKLVSILTAEYNNSRISEILWCQRFFHVATGIRDTIVLQPDILSRDVSINNISVYSWTVNEQANYCNDLDKVSHVDTWISERRTFLRDETLFLQDVKVNLKGCAIKACIIPDAPYSGVCNDELCTPIETVINAVSKSLNATFILRRDIAGKRQCGILFPCFYDSFQESDLSTYPHISNDLTWFVPAGSEIPRWQSLFRAFSPILWSLVALTFAFGSFTIWLLQKSVRSSTDSFVDVLISALSSHLGIGVADRYKGFVAVVFFILWLFYCLVINAAYQSAFYGLLVDPGHFPAIRTVAELEESGLVMERLFDFSTINRTILNTFWLSILKYDYCHSVSQCFGNVGDRLERAVLTSYDMFKYLSPCYREYMNRHVPLSEVVTTFSSVMCLNYWYYTCLLYTCAS